MAAEVKENPRTRRVRQLILDTAIEVLLDNGAQDVTASVVAERADVARTTIYRYWPDQLSLLLSAVSHLTIAHVSDSPVGNLVVDVPMTLERLRLRLVTREVSAIFGALAGYAAQHEAFEQAQRQFVERLTEPMVEVLTAAQERGDLDDDVDCRFEATLLTAPILHQHLALNEEITNGLIEQVAGRWLATFNRGHRL